MSGRFSSPPRPWRRWQRSIRDEALTWGLERTTFVLLPAVLGWFGAVLVIALLHLPLGAALVGLIGGGAAGELVRRRACS